MISRSTNDLRRVLRMCIACCALIAPVAANADELAPVRAHADELAACSEKLRAGSVAEHSELTLMSTHFLLPRKLATEDFTFARSGCATFVAFGGARVRDVDLFVYGAEGSLLGEDRRVHPHAIVPFCGERGMKVHLVLKLADGIGEVQLAVLYGDPEEATIESILSRCRDRLAPEVSTLPERPDVGAPQATDLGENLRRMRLDFERHGFVASGGPTLLSPRVGRPHATRLTAKRGLCYGLLVAGSAGDHDLDLAVFHESGAEMIRDAGPARDASLIFCPREDGTYYVVVVAQRGEGQAAVATYTLRPEVAGDAVFEGQALWSAHWAARRMRERGFVLRPVEPAWVQPRSDLTRPLSVQAGRCYALAIVAEEPHGAVALRLALLDDRGNLLARSVRRGSAVLFHCPTASETMHLRASASAETRLRFWVGTSP